MAVFTINASNGGHLGPHDYHPDTPFNLIVPRRAHLKISGHAAASIERIAIEQRSAARAVRRCFLWSLLRATSFKIKHFRLSSSRLCDMGTMDNYNGSLQLLNHANHVLGARYGWRHIG
jgi:hypothetical protein